MHQEKCVCLKVHYNSCLFLSVRESPRYGDRHLIRGRRSIGRLFVTQYGDTSPDKETSVFVFGLGKFCMRGAQNTRALSKNISFFLHNHRSFEYFYLKDLLIINILVLMTKLVWKMEE